MYPWDGKNIYFMGFMATGKSAIGRELAKMLGWNFYDTDELIELAAGKTISRIFAEDGEEAFRDIETEVIRQKKIQQHQVIALGGGAVIRSQNWDYIAASGITICLTAPLKVLASRISQKTHRPLMYNLHGVELEQKIESMLAARQAFYKNADYVFENNGQQPVFEFTNMIFNTIMDEI